MEGGGKAARGKMKNEDLGEIMKKGKGNKEKLASKSGYKA